MTGKRDYDKDPETYNVNLNEKIEQLNQTISQIIAEKDYSKICYSDTGFDSLQNLTYGHDGLLKIFHLLIVKFPLLSKLIADKFDYIFIDEYQDTNSVVIGDLIQITQKSNLVLGLFGDSMQAVYSDGVGDVEDFIKNNTLKLIQKPDNYRCTYEIIDVVNPLRLDGLKQEVALKRIKNGELESADTRHGIVKILYSIFEEKPKTFSNSEDKERYQKNVDQLINKAKEYCHNAKILMLTNKAIAEKNDFKTLYKVFDDRYSDVKDRIEKYLSSIQVMELCIICNAYINHEYNLLIKSIRSGGYIIHKSSDKKDLQDIINGIVKNKDLSVWQAVKMAEENKIIKLSETSKNKVEQEQAFVSKLNENSFYTKFKKLYVEGNNTYNKMKDKIDLASREMFDDWEYQYKREQFIIKMFSEDLKFYEVLNYYKYLSEET